MKKYFPVIQIESDDPYERGLQYGRQAKPYIDLSVGYYKKQFEQKGQSWEQYAKFAMTFVPIVEKSMPELLEEARGIADGSGYSMEEIMLVNCRYEMSKFPRIPECTTAAVLPEASKDGKTYAVKNWDFSEGVLPHLVLLKIKTSDYTAVGWSEAGQLMREGVSSYGVAICNNALQSVYDVVDKSLPVTFLRRKVLSLPTFEQAVEAVMTAKRCGSNNTMIVGADGRVCNMETMPNQVDIVEPENGIVTHANHFRIHPEYDALKDRPRNRDARLYELLMERHGSIDVDYIKECCKDHKYYPLSICGHTNPEGDSYSRHRMTVASMIVDFAARTAHICYGPPCEGEYVEYQY